MGKLSGGGEVAVAGIGVDEEAEESDGDSLRFLFDILLLYAPRE
jgi:hypothetical protein